MKIVVDGMGGDRGSKEILKGVKKAIEEVEDLEIIVVGKKIILEENLKEMNFSNKRLKLINAEETIEMTDEPMAAVKEKKKSSINIGLDLVKKGEGDAFVSAGNTGALISASQIKLRRIKGILRPAIATVFPSKKGKIVFMDVGANADTKPEYINQFATMGSKFAKEILKVNNPKVSLLNIGSEEGKGNEITRQSYDLLRNNKNINFLGNIESREMMFSNADVIVSDGFTGNMVLKTCEGMVNYIFSLLKEEISSNFFAKIGLFFLRSSLKNLKNKLDSSEYGGASFLGLNGISIKAHGNSDYRAIKNAIIVADKFAKNGFIEKLKETIKNN